MMFWVGDKFLRWGFGSGTKVGCSISERADLDGSRLLGSWVSSDQVQRRGLLCRRRDLVSLLDLGSWHGMGLRSHDRNEPGEGSLLCGIRWLCGTVVRRRREAVWRGRSNRGSDGSCRDPMLSRLCPQGGQAERRRREVALRCNGAWQRGDDGGDRRRREGVLAAPALWLGKWILGRAPMFGLCLCLLVFGCCLFPCLVSVVVLLTISPASFERGLGLAVLSGCQHDSDSPLHGVWQFWITVSERVNRFIFLLVAGLYRYSWVWMFHEVASQIWLELAVLSGCQLDGDSPLHGVWQFWITVFERVNRFIFLLVAGLYRFSWIWLFLGVASQAVFWLVLPKLIREEKIKVIMTILLVIFLFQFLPKVYHSICLMRRMAKVTGYIFGTIWWGFALNLIAYFIASHVAGGCWYVLAIQRVASCLKQQCELGGNCNLSLSCSQEVCYQSLIPDSMEATPCGNNVTNVLRKPSCLDVNGTFNYGIYQWALPVISSNSLAIKILYPIFWGLMTLSTFGNDLEPTSHWLEVIFSICIVLSGLLLFTLLIGNIQVFLHAVMAKKRKMQLRCRDMEWWMRRRQLPSALRRRVRHYERHRWATMGGEDEMDLIKDLPEGLRREIKRHLCIDLIKKVPLFHNLDDLILDNICDRVRPLVFSRDEKIIREGDPVPKMLFIVRGRIKRSQGLSKGMVGTNVLEPGGFLGDELLSWCLRRPFIDRLPASSATFSCIESTEAFGLNASDLRYITDHFRYKFANERLKRTARYYSSNWRTWAAVNIQFAWRRYRLRTRGPVIPVVTPEQNGGADRKLLQYAALFMSLRPHDHLE